MKGNSGRIPTYINGFDNLINGGFHRRTVNLLSGGPGTGKSIFCMQYLYNGIVKSKQKGLFISFEEDIKDLKEDAKSFGWDFDFLEKKGWVRFIYLYPYEVTNLHSRLVTEMTKINAERIVVDSTSTFGMALEGEYEVRKELYALASHLKNFDCSTIITSEIVGEASLDHHTAGNLSRFGVEEFIADSVITLHYLNYGAPHDRAIRIVKMRRTNHYKGPVPLEINEKGVRVLNEKLSSNLL